MLTLLTIMAATVAVAPALKCEVDRDVMLGRSPQVFDQDMIAGWRSVASKQGCEEVAADLIARYRVDHLESMTPLEVRANYWHEGQLRATLGQSERAIPLLLASVDPNSPSKAFAEYAVGTVAFIEKDEAGLREARSRLAATPEPESFATEIRYARERYGMTLVWPPNLDVLDGLIACFDRPYGEAYSNCRPTAER